MLPILIVTVSRQVHVGTRKVLRLGKGMITF
jgi:hypothetical protein